MKRNFDFGIWGLAFDRNSAQKLKIMYIKFLYAFECMDIRNQNISDADIKQMRFTSTTRTPRACDNLSSATDSPRESHEKCSTENKTEDLSSDFQSISNGQPNYQPKKLSKEDFSEKLNNLMTAQGFTEAQVGMISGAENSV